MKNKFRTRLAVIFMSAFLMLGLLVIVPACGGQNSGTDFTVEQHIRWASSAVQFQFVDSGDFESFEIHPIYNGATGAFSNFLLVEFAPIGFMYVQANYSLSPLGCSPFHSRVDIILRASELALDEASHFYEFENGNRYFFVVDNLVNGNRNFKVVPAIKEENGFLNLITNKLFDGSAVGNQETITLNFSHGMAV